jgi:hypothetical protein
MPKLTRNPARDRRIHEEIMVDAYDPVERAYSWYYYLDENLPFPFQARCIAPRTVSPLKKGEEVTVIAMCEEEDCTREMFVRIELAGRRQGVPLSQLEPLKVGADARRAIEDWRYWVARGYGF